MGQNRRYGSDITRAVVADVVIRPTPVSLSAVEVGEGITRTDDPVRVVAWVPFRTEQTAQVDARVIAYTDTACQVEFTTRPGHKHQVWVWRGAVKLEAPRGQ